MGVLNRVFIHLLKRFPVGDHDLLKSQESLLLNFFILMAKVSHDGRLEVDLLENKLALRVLTDDLSSVPAGDGENGRLGLSDFLGSEDGAKGTEGRVVVLIETVDVGSPEALRAMNGGVPGESLTEKLVFVDIEGRERIDLGFEVFNEFGQISVNVLVGPSLLKEQVKRAHNVY